MIRVSARVDERDGKYLVNGLIFSVSDTDSTTDDVSIVAYPVGKENNVMKQGEAHNRCCPLSEPSQVVQALIVYAIFTTKHLQNLCPSIFISAFGDERPDHRRVFAL